MSNPLRFIGVREPAGAPYPIALYADDQNPMGVELASTTKGFDLAQPIWVSAPLEARDLSSLGDPLASRYFTYEDTTAGKFVVIDITDGAVVWELGSESNNIAAYQEMIVTDSQAQRVLFVDGRFGPEATTNFVLATHGSPDQFTRFSTPNRGVFFVTFSPVESRIVYAYGELNAEGFVAGAPGRIVFFDPSTMTETMVIDDGFNTLRQLAFSPDGTKLGVMTGPDFRVYDVASGKRLDTISITVDLGSTFAFSADSTKVYLGTFGGKIIKTDLILVPPMTEVTETQQ